jgi:hypothetical protein
MGWQAAVVMGAMQYQQQGAIGKYNQAVQNRNATIAEQEAAMIEKQLEFDIGRFDQQFQQLKGTTEVNLNKSGVVSGEGTALRIARYNAEQAVLQKNVMDYNSKVAVGKKLEEANFARIQGTIYKQQAELARINTIARTGTSLMTMGSGVSGTNTAQLNMAYPAQYGTF